MAKARQQYFADETSIAKDSREFAITPEILEKINSIEPGAQVNVIETVKVNGEALTPDENKAVDIDVPLVDDTLYSTSSEDALSARQGRILYDYIQNLQSRGRFLSNWNCVTGLAMTNPVDNPYPYSTGDYYLVSNVAALGGTNYRPNGAQYVINQASTTVETDVVKVGDMYIYDGTNWLLLVNTEREIAVDSSLSTTSTNPVENRVITNALNTKQDNISDLATIRSGAALGATSLQPGDSLSQLTGTSDDITQGSTNLFMTTSERSKLSNQSGINTGDETQTTIKNKLGQASTSTDGYLTSTDWNTFNGKQDAISDLSTIRSNASAGKSASDTIATYGDIVTHDVSEFATSAQGGLADTAIQPGDNISELTNDAGYVTPSYHDVTKQDALIAGANIQIAADGKTISATDTTYVAGDFDIKDLADSTGLRTEWSGKQDELIAGNNIQIAADGKTISSTDTTYTAGVNVSISNNNVISATDSKAEWGNISGTLSDQTDLNTALGGKQDTLIAGANIQIASDGKTISSTDTTYTAGTGISIDSNNVISNTQTSAEWGNITGTLSSQTDLQSALDAKQDDMVILKYGISTWNDFITAYQKNGVVYCRASSQSNPATGTQGRLAFMAYVNNADNPTEVEFQYYRSRSSHDSAANQLDEVYVYKLVPTSGGTWTVTQRNTAAKATAGTGINLTYGSGNMTIANTGVTSINSQTGDITLTIPTVPTNVSDFVNDAGYITANDLPTIDTSMSDSSTNAVQNNVIKNYVDTQVQEATSGAVSDTAYGDSWNGITGIAPSKNAVYDKISAMDTTIAGKQNTISDLSTIRTGAGKGATAVQPGDNVSTLTNDAGYITKAVNDLTNYYTKSETYTKSEVADYVANFAGFKVVATLPTTDIKTTVIYLLGPVGSGQDKYEEYIYSNNAWVMIGETSVDLTNYFNTSTQTSDAITQGSTNLFLTSAERTKLGNTSGTNSGDETKTTIQTKLGAASASSDGYLTSTDWNTFNGKQNALSTQTAYTSKGSATKVPQITTNTLGQVTGITEVTIEQPDISGKADKTEVLTKTNTTSFTPTGDYHPATKKYVDDNISAATQGAVSDEAYAASWNGVTGIAPSKNALYDKIAAMDTTISGKQNTLATQTAYTSKGSATKVPQITTNTLGQVTGITEVDITHPSQVDDTAYASSWNGVTSTAPSKNAVYDKISAMDTTISGKQDALTAQTAYTSKGTSSKVPQITTNTLGQVTGITEVDISYPSQIDNTAYGSSWNGVTNKAPTKDAVYDKINAIDGQIADLQAHGKFLSLWNSATGLPVSFPLTTPYTYSTGDYYMVQTLPSSGSKYMPNGSSYSGTASTTVDSVNEVKVGDMYIYDGSTWLYASNHGKDVTFSNIAGSPSDNTNLATALNGKQDKLSAQTAYTSKGTASKVPQITTNTLGQVTGITEVDISYPSQVSDVAYASSWNGVTTVAPSKNVVYDKINAMDIIIAGKQDALTAQTAYSAKGSATKVPQITTNSLGQVTGITEVNITQPDISGKLDKITTSGSYGRVYAISTSGEQVTVNITPSAVANTLVRRQSGSANITVPATPSANTDAASKQYVDTAVAGITAGDMSYSDFNAVAKTGAAITMSLFSTITPSANFTVNAPATIKEGQTYILRVNNESTAYTMTLGTNMTNPFETDLTLTDYGVDQFVFLAVDGKLELQPEGGGGGGGGGAITADTTGTETSISKIRVGTEEEYANLGTYEENVAYMTY